MTSDLLGYLVLMLSIRLSFKTPTSKYSWGYHRLEVLANLAIVMVILGLVISVCVVSVLRLVREANDLLEPKSMVIGAVISLASSVFKMVAFEHVCGKKEKKYGDEMYQNTEDNEEFDLLIETNDSNLTSKEGS